jgi:hypothetical protein
MTRWILAVLALSSACSDQLDTSVTVRMVVSDQAPRYGEVPFPSDALRDGDHLGRLVGLD